MSLRARRIRGTPFKQEIMQLYFGCRDERTPLYARLPALFSLIYLISPFDLIPDFIPFAGYLDDLVIVPLLLHISFRLLPAEVKEASRLKAMRYASRVRIALGILVVLVLLLMVGVFFAVKHLFQGG
ncbi:MAG TPA: YkvA family protein [Puia sp.]|nr:YkvA family protein [Puia sp.]